MAIKFSTAFPGQVDLTSDPTGYPDGKAQDISAPGDGLGTPWKAIGINDWNGFFQAMLAAAGITASGTPDKVGASQYLTALNTLYPSTTDSRIPTQDENDALQGAGTGSAPDDANRFVVDDDSRLAGGLQTAPEIGLVVNNNGATPLSKVDIAADFLTVINASGNAVKLSTLSLTADMAVSGADGLDTGAEAPSTWYYIWVIDDGVTPASLLSVSSTAPTMPGAYTYKRLVGAVYNGSGSDFVLFSQVDRDVTINEASTIHDGAGLTIDAWTALVITSFFPTNAKKVTLAISNQSYAGLSHRSNGFGGQYEDRSGATPTTFAGVFPASRTRAATLTCSYASSVYYFLSSATASIIAISYTIKD